MLTVVTELPTASNRWDVQEMHICCTTEQTSDQPLFALLMLYPLTTFPSALEGGQYPSHVLAREDAD